MFSLHLAAQDSLPRLCLGRNEGRGMQSAVWETQKPLAVPVRESGALSLCAERVSPPHPPLTGHLPQKGRQGFAHTGLVVARFFADEQFGELIPFRLRMTLGLGRIVIQNPYFARGARVDFSSTNRSLNRSGPPRTAGQLPLQGRQGDAHTGLVVVRFLADGQFGETHTVSAQNDARVGLSRNNASIGVGGSPFAGDRKWAYHVRG